VVLQAILLKGLIGKILKRTSMLKSLKRTVKYLLPKYQKIFIEYRVNPKPRYGYGLKPHQMLYDIMNKNRSIYEQFILEILSRKDVFQAIKPIEQQTDENQPSWGTRFLWGIDILALYTMMCHFKPKKYIEIGSGNSTKVAKKAIVDNKLNTKITSIDPMPRANIDHLADEVIRRPIEEITDYGFIINELNENDILFIDGSHNIYPNSDTVVCFLDLLPYLKKGVIIHIHDIYLPYDYPQALCDRYLTEQYMVAAFVMANPQRYKPIFAESFISEDKALLSKLDPIWDHPNTKNA
jgi:hypothetical protein